MSCIVGMDLDRTHQVIYPTDPQMPGCTTLCDNLYYKVIFVRNTRILFEINL